MNCPFVSFPLSLPPSEHLTPRKILENVISNEKQHPSLKRWNPSESLLVMLGKMKKHIFECTNQGFHHEGMEIYEAHEKLYIY